LIVHQKEDQLRHPSDLVTTPLLEEHGLAFNKCWNLMICRSCKEGLPLRSVPEHLMAEELSRWDKSVNKKAPITTNHIPVPPMRTGSVAARAFIDKLAQSLISSGYILSKGDVMDGGSSPEWVKQFPSLPHKPVEGIRVFDGWIDDSGRALRRRNGFSASKKSITRKTPIIKPCFLQTFTETYPNLFPVRATRKEEAAPEHPALEPMDLLRLEKSRLLSQIPSLGKSATDRRALLPIFVDSGIEGWLDQFDRSMLYSQLPQHPAAGKKSTPKSYARLAKADLILLGEDMKALSESHHSICHAITNATP